MEIADLVLAIISVGFNITTTIQLIKVIKTKSARDFALISLSWNTFAFTVEGIVFVFMGFWLTAIPFFYATLVWGTVLLYHLKNRRDDKNDRSRKNRSR